MTRLVGELVAVNWDINEEPIEVCLETEDDRYIISHSELFDELLDKVDHEVEIEGEVEENIDGEQVIEVLNFKVLNSFEDDFDADNDEEEEKEERILESDEEELIDEEW